MSNFSLIFEPQNLQVVTNTAFLVSLFWLSLICILAALHDPNSGKSYENYNKKEEIITYRPISKSKPVQKKKSSKPKQRRKS
jgi:hypothetical protein